MNYNNITIINFAYINYLKEVRSENNNNIKYYNKII